jgi:hypothetical protein
MYIAHRFIVYPFLHNDEVTTVFYVVFFLPAGSMAEQARNRCRRWSMMEVWAAATSSGASDLHNTQYISQNLISIYTGHSADEKC